MHAAGSSLREIEEAIGVKKDTANRILIAVANERDAQTRQEEDSCPFDVEPFFDEEDCDVSPAINPADAFQRELDAHEEERQEKERL